MALILVGGLGKRLRAAYCEGPKSLAPVAGRPFLDHLLDWLRLSGFSDIVLCVGYKGEQIRERYGSGCNWGVRVSYSQENEPLGTAGAIKNAEALVQSDTFLVLNGDSFADVCLARLVQFHQLQKGIATLTLAKKHKTSRYGCVHVNARGEVLGFVEKGPTAGIGGRQKSNWINGGIYAFQREVLSTIPRGRPVSLETDILPGLVGQKFYGFRAEGYFIDIGLPTDYWRAQKDFKERFPQ